MDFSDIKQEIQEKFLALLESHLSISKTNLESDNCVLPFLMTTGETPDSNVLMGLQPQNGKTDVDVALQVALQILKTKDFEVALFSYSTKIGSGDGKFTDALKTYIFDKSGLSVVFFTPYKLSGLFRKKVAYEKSIIGEIIENILK
jgi:hypothetical protein